MKNRNKVILSSNILQNRLMLYLVLPSNAFLFQKMYLLISYVITCILEVYRQCCMCCLRHAVWDAALVWGVSGAATAPVPWSVLHQRLHPHGPGVRHHPAGAARLAARTKLLAFIRQCQYELLLAGYWERDVTTKRQCAQHEGAPRRGRGICSEDNWLRLS